MTFRALYLQKNESGFTSSVMTLDDTALDDNPLASGEVLVRVLHSSMNYKDGLAIANAGPVVRGWPMVAGIDGAGEVIASADPAWQPGDYFLVNGWGLGETHWGCMAERARLKGEWLVKLPTAFTTADAMAIGTAGYTAMLSCLALQANGVKPSDGDVLVTGASGGVGSIAVAILGGWGYHVVASTGKPEQGELLTRLGATSLVDRATLSQPGKPLQKERWAAVVDSVGSHTLANACAQTQYGGVVTACGMAQGMDFPSSVAPFILRGVRLIGIDSVMCPMARRQEAWARLATDLSLDKLHALVEVIALDQVAEAAQRLMAGKVKGRIVVDTASLANGALSRAN